MSAPIVNQFGRPYESSTGRYSGTEDSRYRLDRPRLDGDMALLLSRHKHKMVVNDGRWIREAFPIVGGAVEQKADYVSAAGWLPEFYGSDRAWGEAVTERLHMALNIADVRGALFDWTDDWWTASCSLDVDGSVFPLLTETASGFPQVQMIETHRIGQRGATVGIVGERDAYTVVRQEAGVSTEVPGFFKGFKIINGIIYDSGGAEIGYRILGDSPALDRDVSARDMLHVTHPRWFTDGRPFPAIAYSALDWYDVKEARELQRQAQKVHAALTLVESNDTGQAPAIPALGAGPSTPKTNGEPQAQTLLGGMIRYVRSGGGELKAHESGAPSDGWRSFDQTIVAGAMIGMGWRAEMMDLSKLGGAGVRGFQDNINTAIFARHRRLARHATRIICYFVSKLIARGDIPESPDWYKWMIPLPPEFSVDAGRAAQADRDNIRFGVDCHPDVIRRSLGVGYLHVLRKQAEYVARKKEIAKEFGLEPEEIATNLKVGDSTETVQRIAPSEEDETDKAARAAHSGGKVDLLAGRLS